MSVRANASRENLNSGHQTTSMHNHQYLDGGCHVMLLSRASGTGKGFLRSSELGRFRGPRVCIAEMGAG